MKKTVFVIGLGLIGGSIALAIRHAHEDTVIYGHDVSNDQAKLALSLKVVDVTVENIADGAAVADLIVIAAPVQQATQIIETLAQCPVKDNVIITDVCSTKVGIVEKAKLLREKNIAFIGGHPMAGSHKSGVIAAKKHLFENAFYILTPEDHITKEQVNTLKQWLKGTKATIVEMTPELHDHIVGAVSHFPHIIAASLVHQVASLEKENPIIADLAAGGFRDITRIASSSPVMWRDILLQNKNELLELFEKWQKEMDKIKKMIENIDSSGIYQYFLDAKSFRDGLPQKQKGAIPSFYDLYVDIPDVPGVISYVTGILAKKEISITNIRIIETRVDILGVLRLSFQSNEDRQKAKECLEEFKFETYILD